MIPFIEKKMYYIIKNKFIHFKAARDFVKVTKRNNSHCPLIFCFSEDDKKMNLKWIQFYYEGIAYIVQVVWRDTQAGEELKTFYGEYYDVMRNHKKRSKN